MQSSQPLITAVIPVFNGERYIAAAIESVLAQSCGRFELIVVDDGSSDQTSRVVERYGHRVRYEQQRNAGPSAARNRGIGLASGEMIAFLDADDLWLPHKTAVQLARMAQPEQLVGCGAHVQNFMTEEQVSPGTAVNDATIDQAVVTLGSTFMVQRQLFDAVGMLNTEYRHCDLQDFIVRASDCGYRTAILPEILARRRVHATNMSHDRARADRMELVAIAQARHARRRAAATPVKDD